MPEKIDKGKQDKQRRAVSMDTQVDPQEMLFSVAFERKFVAIT